METMGESDPFVDTKGHCFLCLERFEEEWDGSRHPYSLRGLSLYLKIGMSDVLKNVEGASKLTPGQSGSQSNSRQRWEVPLCYTCSKVNQDFLEVNRRLEEIQLEMIGCLEWIHRRLTISDDSGALEEFRKSKNLIKTKSNDRKDDEKTRCVLELRQEMVQKCALELCLVLSSFREKIGTEELNKPRLKSLKSTSRPNRVTRSRKMLQVQLEDPDMTPAPTYLGMPDADLTDGEDSSDTTSSDYIPTSDLEEESKPSNSEKKGTSDDLRAVNNDEIDCVSNEEDNVEENEKETNTNTEQFQIVYIPESPDVDWKPQRNINPKTGKYKCKICSKEFDKNDTFKFQYHYKSIHLKMRYKCIPCGKEFLQHTGFRFHHQSVHLGRKFKCRKCNRAFSLQSSLVRHHQRLSCGKVPALNSVITKVSKIQKEKGGPQWVVNPETEKLKCSLCSKEFKNIKSLRGHHKTVHLETRYKCNICEKEFLCRQSATQHHKSIHMGEVFSCPGCDKPFSTEQSRANHQETTGCGTKQAPKPLSQNHICERCGKGFISNSHLKRHFKGVHLKLREYKCDVCGKDFAKLDSLKEHKKSIHLQLLEHQCDLCGKMWISKAAVSRHRREVHLKIRRKNR